ncbi:MAG TPA: A/G-specific adenine glycosylase [Burkholderiales bacterium]|nr:A/G-specific adenine glycosylase [Burkholderiales bacterium]
MDFAAKLIRWQRRSGRSGLPWQGVRDAYRVWLSEVMLQQTQVAAVIPYYLRFVERFPSVEALAAAQQDEVLRLWSGLGYYARGRNLHAAAQVIVRDGFPRTAAGIEALPGVGRSTAGAIAAFAFGERAAILDGNVKRVLARAFGVEGWPGERTVQEKLWTLAESLLPARGIETYSQALMDLGATVCTPRPRCAACPLRKDCSAYGTGRVAAIPAPRPRRALPVREATWHVVRHREWVLLERRKAEGLWGGLLTFPERRPATLKAAGRALAPLEHGFTHFRLRIRPLLYDVARRPSGAGWTPIADALSGAVPAPVRKVLKALPTASRSGGRAAPPGRPARGASA